VVDVLRRGQEQVYQMPALPPCCKKYQAQPAVQASDLPAEEAEIERIADPTEPSADGGCR